MPTEVTEVSFGDGQAVYVSNLGIGDQNKPIGHWRQCTCVRIHLVSLHTHGATEAGGLIRRDGPQKSSCGIDHWTVARPLAGDLRDCAAGFINRVDPAIVVHKLPGAGDGHIVGPGYADGAGRDHGSASSGAERRAWKRRKCSRRLINAESVQIGGVLCGQQIQERIVWGYDFRPR